MFIHKDTAVAILLQDPTTSPVLDVRVSSRRQCSIHLFTMPSSLSGNGNTPLLIRTTIRQPPPRGHVQFGCRRSHLLQSGESSCSAILFTKLKTCSAILSTQLKTCSAILIALIDPFSIFPGSLLHSGARVFDKQFQQHSPAEHRLTSVSVEVDGMMVCKIAPEMLVVPHLMANGS